MGKTRDTGFLTDCVFTDSSNNVGIGAAASGSYKLQVTGTSNFTSTINGAGVSLSDTLNGTTANFTSSVTGNFFIASPVATAAQSGGLRLNSQVAINARNAANSADITLITTNSSDGVAIRNGALNINSSGNVGIGTSSPAVNLHINSSADTGIRLTSSGGAYSTYIDMYGAGGGGAAIKAIGSGIPMVFETGGSERMRITSGGQVNINAGTTNTTFTDNNGGLAIKGSGGSPYISWHGDTGTRLGYLQMQTSGVTVFQSTQNIFIPSILELGTTGLNGRLGIYSGFTSKVGIDMRDSDDASNAYYLFFRKSNGTGIGSIQRNGLTDSILYNTTSDYRLKEDFKEINGLDKISAIKVYDFKWKGLEERMDGVIAHELQEIMPYAVSGVKDAVDEDGNIKSQGVDYSKIVPTLIKAIQEQNQLISELSAKVSALENK
jgi:hypothetical protein